MEITYSLKALNRKIVEVLRKRHHKKREKIYRSYWVDTSVYIGDRRNWFLRKIYLEVLILRLYGGKRKVLVCPRSPDWNKEARILGKEIEAQCRVNVEVREA